MPFLSIVRMTSVFVPMNAAISAAASVVSSSRWVGVTQVAVNSAAHNADYAKKKTAKMKNVLILFITLPALQGSVQPL